MEHDLLADAARAIAVSLADGGAGIDLHISEYGTHVLAAALARVRGQN